MLLHAIPPAAAFAIHSGMVFTAALAAGPARRIALVPATLCFMVPWLVSPDHPLVRAALTLGALLCLFRTVDLIRERRSWPFWRRLLLMSYPFDTRSVARAPRSFDGARLLAAVGYLLLGAAGLWVALFLAPASGAGRWALRWGGGAVFAYCMPDVTVNFLTFVHRALGVVMSPVHRTPILSRTVQEFWGERWNLLVHSWLARHCFMPLARRRQPQLGVAAAFGASTALHAWLALVVGGAWAAVTMGSFFVVQGVLLLVERRLGAARWPSPLARAFTVVALLVPSPLFVEPSLSAFEASRVLESSPVASIAH
jgi:hypothetical protein